MALLNRRKSSTKTPGKAASDPLNFDQIDYYAQRESGRLNFDLLPLSDINLDPSNPRTRGIDPRPLLAIIPKFLVIDPQHALYDARALEAFDSRMRTAVEALIDQAGDLSAEHQRLFDGLWSLRDNIRLIGVKQPIEVKKTGRKSSHQIIYGHRRYLASILAGERNIPTRIVSEDAPVKTSQAAENLHQEKLTLPQRLEMIRQLFDELAIDIKMPATRLCSLTGYEKSQMSLYLQILRNASPALNVAIGKGLIDQLRVAADIAKLPAEDQPAAISAANKPMQNKTVPTRPGKGRGRPKRYITTPHIREPKVIQTLLDHLDLDLDTDIDWQDLRAVETLWSTVIKQLQQRTESKSN